jgi:MBOAT, membrane-bound O-acyltransferase family
MPIRGNTMLFALVAVVVAHIAAAAFFPALGLPRTIRTLAWLVCSAVVGLSPCLVPLGFPTWRLVSTLVAIELLAKLYDVFHSGDLAFRRGIWFYLAWLPNGFWLVLRRTPPPIASRDDWNRLSLATLRSAACLALLAGIFALDWSNVSVVVEHSVKVIVTYATVVSVGQIGAVAYRLSGGAALDPMLSPAGAPTPAEFWRRWNRPAQQLLEMYAFRPAGGLRRPVRATLFTFAISGAIHEYVFGIAAGDLQGWQAAFFLTQGVAAAVTMHLRPTGWRFALGQFLTVTFNLAASVLFFQSLNSVLPFYSPRSS